MPSNYKPLSERINKLRARHLSITLDKANHSKSDSNFRLDNALRWSRRGVASPVACEICSKPFKHSHRAPARDHCHQSGRDRGYLCGQCNLGLGSFKDNIGSLLRAAEYLEASYYCCS